jgi:hypothetical protein
VFSLKKGRIFGRSGKEPVTLLFVLSLTLKEQIDSAIKEQLSNTWQKTLQGLDINNMKDTWRITKSSKSHNPMGLHGLLQG